MFTMVAALQKGIPLDTTYNAEYQFETNEPATRAPMCNGHYCPHNDNKNMSAVHSMFSAFGESVNTYFVHLEQQIGVKAAVEAAQKLGVVFRAKHSNGMNEADDFKQNGGLSFTIGTPQVSPLDMANAYATLAARGRHCDPMPVLKVVDRSGKEVKGVAAPRCDQAIPPTIADAANAAARCPTGDGPRDVCTRHNGWTAGYIGSHMEREIAGKSGTTDSDAASWLVGYTPNLASAVFIANPDSPTEDVGSDLHERPKVIFTAIMNDALNGMPDQDFTDPPSSLVHGETSGVPDVAGMDLAQAKSQIRSAGFSWHVESAQVPSQYPAGKVAKTDPAGGSSATVNSDISIYLSNGQGATGTGIPGIPGIPGLPGKPGKPHR
jgi:membrane peptidoglycan carboxypeptidase